jgi:hypothetical protein
VTRLSRPVEASGLERYNHSEIGYPIEGLASPKSVIPPKMDGFLARKGEDGMPATPIPSLRLPNEPFAYLEKAQDDETLARPIKAGSIGLQQLFETRRSR